MWWALLYCMLLPLFLCEQASFNGRTDTNPNAPDDTNEIWSNFCLNIDKIPSPTSHATIEVIFDFRSEVTDNILIYWGNNTGVCIGSNTSPTKQITVLIAHNGTSLCNWDIKQLNTGKFVGMVNTTAALSEVSVIEYAEEFIDIIIEKPCPPPHLQPPNHSQTSFWEGGPPSQPPGHQPPGGGSTGQQLPFEDVPGAPGSVDIWRPFPGLGSVVESELGYIIELETTDFSEKVGGDEPKTTLFNLLFGMSLGVCFLVIITTLFFANCAFISGKKKKKPVFVADNETYYLPAVAFTPPDNDPIEYFIQPPPMTVVKPDTIETSSQFDAFQPTVLTQPIKYFNLLYLLKHVVPPRNPVVTESI